MMKEKFRLSHLGIRKSKSHWKNIKLAQRKLWKNPIYRKRQIKLILEGINRSPNKPEKTLINLIKKNNLPFHYVGNGKVIIEGFNPDFINNNGKKQIIEVNGDYWHNLPKMIKKDKKKMKIYRKYGYKTLIIWENELIGNFNQNRIIDKIKKLYNSF